ncbi:MAG: T9SS type A sorting domain-containing protein, partial [Candidatus Dadabacteria bacterium]|nr:T9SS type A sorting domain-containing protein [Candidatus Dadabacteria bacterium]NIQ16584.1 T9SS type A sorting domain-containing protein [Candidatus Dadabacteria bacterium]
GNIELINAFSFTIHQNVPENHLAQFELTIKDEIGNIWTQSQSFKVVIQRTITGIVSSANSGLGIPNALITWTKINTDSNKIVEIDTIWTDKNGKYTLSLLGGKYAVQISANGYSTPDAQILPVPTPDWLLNFSLKIADYKLDSYYIKIDTSNWNEYIENFVIHNVGNAPLFYTIQEDVPDNININNEITIPEILLRSDPNDGIPYDLKDVYCEQISNRISIKITTFQEIYPDRIWNLSVFIDTDLNQETGQKVGKIGADYQLSYVESKTSLLKYIDGVWENDIYSGSTAKGKKVLIFKFDPSIIGDPKKFHLVVILHEGETSDSRVVRDIIPDDGGLLNVTFSRYKSNWLAVNQPFNVIPSGAFYKVRLLISSVDSLIKYNGTKLILHTNSPIHDETIIPIGYDNLFIKAEAANNMISSNHIILQQNYPNPFNNQTNIRFSLSHQSKVKLTILNSIGQEIVTLCDSQLSEGAHTIYWNGKNEEGVDIGSGIYFIKLETEKWNKIMKALLLR